MAEDDRENTDAPIVDEHDDDEDDRALFADPSRARIGIWGMPGSGKTTYLAALSTATLLATGNWRMDPDPAVVGSERFLIDRHQDLRSGSFPLPSTVMRGVVLGFIIAGEQEVQVPKRWGGTRRAVMQTKIHLAVRDYPGGAYETGQTAIERVSAFLARCDGILYLFDPVESIENFKYFFEVLMRVRAHTGARGGRGLRDGRLPQPLAVCFTKYDDDDVFAQLSQRGRIILGDQLGRVIPLVANPRDAFVDYADFQLVRLIESNFATIEYFALSAVGFRTGPDGRVDPNDWSNIVQTAEGPRIRDGATPVGLLEPLIWLDQEMRALKG